MKKKKDNWWKRQPYWLRGGIIFLIIFLLIDFIYVLSSKLKGGSAWGEAEAFFGLYTFPFTYIIIFIAYGLFIFIAGALIGFIIGKVKGRKKLKGGK